MLKNVRLKHFIEDARIFRIQISSRYWIKNGFALIKLIVEKLLFRKFNPFSVVDKKALFRPLHFLYESLIIE